MWKKITTIVGGLPGAVISTTATVISDNKKQKREAIAANVNKRRTSICDFADAFDLFANGSDKLSYDQIDNVKRNKICRQHKLPNDTPVYYFREHSSDWTFAVSEVGLSFKYLDKDTEEFNSVIFPWNIVDKVEYDSEDDSFLIYLVNDNEPMGFDSYQLIKGSAEEYEFAKILSQMASCVENESNSIFDRIDELGDKQDWIGITEYCEEKLDEDLDDNVKAYLYYSLAKSYNMIADAFKYEEKFEKARECNEKALHHINESLELIFSEEALFWKAEILSDLGGLENYCTAREIYIGLMSSEDKEMAQICRAKYENITNVYMGNVNYFCERYEQDLKKIEMSQDSEEEKNELRECLGDMASNKFTNIVKLHQRQFLMFVKDSQSIAGCVDDEGNIQYVFTLDKYPKDIVFPTGHPQANELYMMHPMLHTHYLPCENIKETLFLDKVRDFCYVAQCLGATKIHFKAIKGEVYKVDGDKQSEASVSIGRKLAKVESSVNQHKTDHYDSTKNSGREWEYTFNPMEQPYCPEDSVWLKSDMSWQQMVKMRLQGNQLSFTERITSSETVNMSSNQQRGVEASFSTLLWKVSGKAGDKAEEIIFKSEESEYVISVTFKPLNEYGNVVSIDKEEPVVVIEAHEEQLTPNEERYKDEILFFLEDGGVISSDERVLLERKRVRLGIAEERAKEIEQMCCPSLTEAEQEYVDIYKELCADGEMTDRRRRMLDRERDDLGISEQRAKELEAKV